MNLTRHLLNSLLFAAITTLFFACTPAPVTVTEPEDDGFSFAFMTDIHVQRENQAISGFRTAINKVNELAPDFVITGGDLVMDALGVSYERADSLYYIYNRMLTEFNMPVFNTLGNHEIYGWYARSGADTNHPEYGKKMYEKRIGRRYYRTDFDNWVFFFLDSVVKDGKGGYEGGVDAEQIAWLKEELATIDSASPIVITTHIPMLTVGAQIYEGPTAANPPSIVVVNAKEVIDLFKDHNLKLVLQGHLHFYETIHVFGTDYITGGAVSGGWWEGPYYNTEEGFVLLKVQDGELTWEYIDYGWEAGS